MAEIAETVPPVDSVSKADNDMICSKCKEPFSHEKPARLLMCLHSFCDACIETFGSARRKQSKNVVTEKSMCGPAPDACQSFSSAEEPAEEKKPCCPECNTEYNDIQSIINPFVDMHILQKPEPRTEDGSPTEGKLPICTSCDDNQKASLFCMDCKEWLCDPCVVAHRRVKITKDHIISNKVHPEDIGTAMEGDAMQRNVYCKIHKTETLKLFCLTCETLTCRDCQLNEHKDHKYQFIEETIQQQRKALTDGVNQLKGRLEKNHELSEKIAEKEKDIKKQQVEVFNEVRQVADMITNELISWCKQLLNFLQGVCHGRVRDLTYKKKEVDSFARKAKHTIDFIESALSSGDDLSVLCSKSFMSKSLESFQKHNITVPTTMFDLNLKYENDVKFLTKNVRKMGFINVNGKLYPQLESESPQKPPTQLPLHLTKENFSENIANLLNQYPIHVREKYKSLSSDKKKQFLHTLMQAAVKKQQSAQQQIQQQQQLQQKQQQFRVQQQQAMQQQQQIQQQLQQQLHQQQQQQQNGGRAGPFNSDSSAIRELYKTQQPQQQQHISRSFNRQVQPPPPVQNVQHWRGSATGPIMSAAPVSGTGPGFNPLAQPLWPGVASESMQNLVNICNNAGSSEGATPPTMGSWNGAPAKPTCQVIESSRNHPPTYNQGAGSVPSGRFDIDPLNLRGQDPNATAVRVKMEPKDKDSNPPSCVFSGTESGSQISAASAPTPAQIVSPPPAVLPSNTEVPNRLQSPPAVNSSMTPPAATPSPSQIDGGHVSTTMTLPDVDVIDNDRNELLKGLTHPSGQKFSVYHLHPKHDLSDPSEDYCAVCHNGGDLLCCDRCPKVFHLQCHVPTINSNLTSSEVWSCTMCKAEEEMIIKTPIVHEFEIMSNGKRKAPNGLVDKEIKVCERILLELFCLEVSTVFHEPVPKSVPNYHKVIHNPMDFATIKCKLRVGHFAHYNTVEDFLSDVKLVFRNCFKFNNASSEVYQVGKSVENFFESLVKLFLPCYIDHLLRRSPSPTPPLEPNGGGDHNKAKKQRRSPAPDANTPAASPTPPPVT